MTLKKTESSLRPVSCYLKPLSFGMVSYEEIGNRYIPLNSTGERAEEWGWGSQISSHGTSVEDSG
jgi:hypothetical protein